MDLGQKCVGCQLAVRRSECQVWLDGIFEGGIRNFKQQISTNDVMRALTMKTPNDENTNDFAKFVQTAMSCEPFLQGSHIPSGLPTASCRGAKA